MKKLIILAFLAISLGGNSQSIGIGYMNFWTANGEFKINKEKDELRLFVHSDDYYPINKMSILYQPHITEWKLHPIIAVGPSVGFWRDRSRSFYYPSDVQLSPNSPWKKNPVIGIDAIAGLEYGTGRVSVEVGAHYWVCLNNNFFGAVRPMATVKYNLWQIISKKSLRRINKAYSLNAK